MARARAVTAIVVLCAALVALAGPAGSRTPGPEPAAWPRGNPVEGDFKGQIAIGDGRELFLRCKGEGSPTVILESGIHDSSATWSFTQTEPPVIASPPVFKRIARFTHVCKYDRPGTIKYSDPPGLTTRSTPVPQPVTLEAMADDLHKLLDAAAIPGPYVLVAHSYGGLIVRLFAQTHPEDAAGMVLVDAFGTNIKPLFGDLWPQYEEILNRPGTPFDNDPEFETVDADEAIAAIEQGPPLPNMPLAVISKTEPFETSPTVPEEIRMRLEEAWPQVQAALVLLEPRTPHVFATGSSHYVQVQDPDLVSSITRLIFKRSRHAGR